MLDRISAKLSLAVYKNPVPTMLNGGYGDLDGWEFLESSQDYGVEGYFGGAFKGNNTIIIAHRGTEITNLEDLQNDLSIFLGQPLSQMPYALNFSSSIEEKYKDTFSIRHTGHSLGALIAEVVGLKYGHPVVSFEAPGAYQTAQYVVKDPAQIKGSLITSYLAAPDIINTGAGRHIANQFYQINHFTNPSGASFLDYMVYSVKQHSMAALAEAFDAQTDKPKSYQIVDKFPQGFEAGYLAFLNSDALWAQKAQIDWANNILLESFTDPDRLEMTEIRVKDNYHTLENYQAALTEERAKARENSDQSPILKILRTGKIFGEAVEKDKLAVLLEAATHHLLAGAESDVQHYICRPLYDDGVCVEKTVVSEAMNICHGIYGEISNDINDL